MNGWNVIAPVQRGVTGLVALLVVTAAACAPPAPVIQGRVVSVDPTKRQVAVQDETRPNSPPVAIDISTAEIGNRPVVGDMVRIVYREEGRSCRALAVMNLTRQQRTEGTGR